MKTLIFIWALSFSASAIAAQTDWACVYGCVRTGHIEFYCKQQCTTYQDEYIIPWQPSLPPIKHYDYKCVSDCTQAGYSYSYCQSRCEY